MQQNMEQVWTLQMKNYWRKTFLHHKIQKGLGIMLNQFHGFAELNIFPLNKPDFNLKLWTKWKLKLVTALKSHLIVKHCIWTEILKLKPLKKRLQIQNCLLRNITVNLMLYLLKFSLFILILICGNILVLKLYLILILLLLVNKYQHRLKKCHKL